MLGTFLVEGIGAMLYMPVFVPEFGARGIWISVFTSISAFCNAGIDIIGENSLCDYATNPIVNLATGLLIVLSGIGYIVWWDVLQTSRKVALRKEDMVSVDIDPHAPLLESDKLIVIAHTEKLAKLR